MCGTLLGNPPPVRPLKLAIRVRTQNISPCLLPRYQPTMSAPNYPHVYYSCDYSDIKLPLFCRNHHNLPSTTCDNKRWSPFLLPAACRHPFPSGPKIIWGCMSWNRSSPGLCKVARAQKSAQVLSAYTAPRLVSSPRCGHSLYITQCHDPLLPIPVC